MIRISSSGADQGVLRLRIEVRDGSSTFVNGAYVSDDWFAEEADALERFGKQIYGGIYDLEAGSSGPEFAEGALRARFHWFTPTRLYISTWQESDYFECKGRQVASECRLFLRTEPALLDRFTAELRAASSTQPSTATLECVTLNGI